LTDHVNVWEELLGERAAVPLAVRRGVELDLRYVPRAKRFRPYRQSAEHQRFLDQRVAELEGLGIIEESSRVKVVLPTFVVEGARQRKVLDARYTNRAERKRSFKMETVRTMLQFVHRNDYGATLDISKAYNALRLHRRSRPFLGFEHNGKTYRYQRLPFGLSSAPRTFTKVMRPVVRHLREKGLRVFIYLDDICILHQDQEVLEQQLDMVSELLQQLGFVMHPKKRTKPLRRFKYLGMVVDSEQMTVEPQADKMGEMRRDARRLLRRGMATPRQLASFLGKITFCLSGMRSGHHKKAPPLRQLRRMLRLRHGWDAKANPLSGETRRCLGWWVHRAHLLLGRLFRPATTPSIRVLSDAGPEGWGAVVRESGQPTQRLSGTWTTEERDLHQNIKEAMALEQAIPAIAERLPTRRVHWVTDSRVLFYTVRKGHSKSDQLSRLVEHLRECLAPARHLHIQHIRSEEMRRADDLSRLAVDRHGWALRWEVFDEISNRWFQPRIDLFATRTNAKLSRYASRHFDPGGVANAWDVANWRRSYAFPPPALLPRLLLEWEERGRPKMIVIAPVWRAQPWWAPLVAAARSQLSLENGAVFRPDSRMSEISSHWRFSAFCL
jgi:ribonuclease HI